MKLIKKESFMHLIILFFSLIFSLSTGSSLENEELKEESVSCAAIEERIAATKEPHQVEYFSIVDSCPIKGANVAEGCFFDPKSHDLEIAFNQFVLNTSNLYSRDISHGYLIRNNGRIDPERVADLDIEMLNSCMMIDSMVSSKALGPEQETEIFKKFWKGLGVFDRAVLDELTDLYVVKNVQYNDEEKEEEEQVVKKKANKASSKKGNKKTNKKKGKGSKSVPGIPFLKSPIGSRIAATLNEPMCQRTLVHAVRVLSGAEVSRIFAGLPLVVLEDVELLNSIEDFSHVDGGEAREALVELYRSHLSDHFGLTEAMMRSLPVQVIFSIIEARHFDVSFWETELLLHYRPGIFNEEPFASHHGTFGLMAIDGPAILFSTVPVVDFLLKQLGKGTDGFVIESLLAFYIRSEAGIHYAINYILSSDGNDGSDGILMALRDLQELFLERQDLINGVESSKLKRLLSTCLNPQFRAQEEDFSVFLSSAVSSEGVISAIPYEKDSLRSCSQIYGLFEDILSDPELNISDRFKRSRWHRNFVQSLLLYTCPDDKIDQFRHILSIHGVAVDFGQNLQVTRFDWFIRPIEALYEIEDGQLRQRELRKILFHVDFKDRGTCEAFWSNEKVMTTLVATPMALCQRNIDALMATETGRQLLKCNACLLQNLPSFGNFSLADVKEFNLALDDFAPQIGTLNVQVARDWLAEREWLMNRSTRGLFRANPTIFTASTDLDRFSLVTFESFRSSPIMAMEFNLHAAMDISHHFSAQSNLSICEQLSLFARWLIHMEIQMAWQWIVSRIPDHNSPRCQSEMAIFTVLQTRIMAKIMAHLPQPLDSSVEAEKIEKLIQIVTQRTISSFIAAHNEDENLKLNDSQIVQDSDFILSLIQNGPGSSRFKRIWCLRGKLLVLLKSDLKTFNPTIKENLQLAFDQGSIPLDDALLFWFLSNRLTLERMRVVSKIRSSQNLPHEPLSQNVPFASFFNTLFYYA
jgi:hypothetical protein